MDAGRGTAGGNQEVSGVSDYRRAINYEGQLSLDDSVSPQDEFLNGFRSWLKEVYARNMWYQGEWLDLLKAHPEYDFVSRITDEGDSALDEFRSFLAGINDAREVQELAKYYDQGRLDREKKKTSSAIKKMKAEMRSRVSELLAKNGRKLDFKSGQISTEDLYGEFLKLNNADMYTPSGNRRSFDSLHFDYNLANIVKAMKGQPKQGRSQFLSGARQSG